MTAGVYLLIDPSSAKVRYVGSSDDIEKRIIAHKSVAKTGPSTPVSKWIREIIDAGEYLFPVVKVAYRHTRGTREELLAVEEKMIREIDPDLNVYLTGPTPAKNLVFSDHSDRFFEDNDDFIEWFVRLYMKHYCGSESSPKPWLCYGRDEYDQMLDYALDRPISAHRIRYLNNWPEPVTWVKTVCGRFVS